MLEATQSSLGEADMDIVDALLGEHGALHAQFDHLEGAVQDAALSAVKAQAELLAAALQSHSTLEDELLFAPLEPFLGAGSPELLGMRMMHEEIDRGLEACRDAAETGPAQRELLGVIGLARQHFLGEEQTLFPLAQQRLPRQIRARLGAQWAVRRGINGVPAEGGEDR
jgi:hemerythrin-like domain-containing protein